MFVLLILGVICAVIPSTHADALTFNNPLYKFTQLTTETTTTGARAPSFSPDGTKIAYQRGVPPSTGEIWVMNRDGSNKIRISEPAGYQGNPFWSPDGSKIGYLKNIGTNTVLMVVDVTIAGGVYSYSAPYVWYNPASVLGGPDDMANFDWFPDGNKIVFWHWEPPADLYIYDKIANTETRLTNTPDISEYEPHVSPDGTTILYWSGETPSEAGPNVHSIPVAGNPPGPVKDIAMQAWCYGRGYNRLGTIIAVEHCYLAPGPTITGYDILFYDTNGIFISNLTGLGEVGVYVLFPSWGPHGEVVFASKVPSPPGYRNIWLAEPIPPVGGYWVPVSKLELLVPWIGLASLLMVPAVAVSLVYVKHRKKQQN